MIRPLVAVCALLHFGIASACSCIHINEAGFIHADLKRLPSNARGALFLVPDAERDRPAAGLTPESFTITSDQQSGPLKATLSWPSITADGQAQRVLARVGPSAGFKPGARYTISYNGSFRAGRHPAKAEFIIDAAPLRPGTYTLAVDGPPSSRLLELSTNDGGCGAHEPAAVQPFRYVLPEGYDAYRSAMMYVSVSRSGTTPFAAINYRPSLCSPRIPGATFPGEGRDLVYAKCATANPGVEIRGLAGLLEVEDRLQSTNVVQVDFSKAAGLSCQAIPSPSSHRNKDAQF